MQTHLYFFQAEISVLLRDFLTWLNPPLIGHLGLFTVPAVVGLTSCREVHGCFFHSAYRHLVDNVTNSVIKTGEAKISRSHAGSPDRMLQQPFHAAEKTRIDPGQRGDCVPCEIGLGGVNMSPFLEETFFSCFM